MIYGRRRDSQRAAIEWQECQGRGSARTIRPRRPALAEARDNHLHWPSSRDLLEAAERAGFDSHLQYGMWSGYGGPSGWNDASNSASLDVPAKDVRYDIVDEFTTLLKHLWTSHDPVDFEGEYFQAHGAQVNPQPASRPRPFLMSAAGSDTGLDFASKHCDALFITSQDSTAEAFRRRAEKLHAMAASHGREVRICAMCYVVMDDTDAKAAETVDWLREEIDRSALESWLVTSGHVLNSEAIRLSDDKIGDARSGLVEDPYLGIGEDMFNDLGLGMGAYKLFGSYETVAEQLAELYEAGVEQVALCFFDPHKGVQQVGEHLLPLLRKRGLNR
jgi:alkanesulfonate monooxygenase SsuD/methylene tetrahydromethanopterin reductase-like flavin-dependent oxidoreductase (luciferase family)